MCEKSFSSLTGQSLDTMTPVFAKPLRAYDVFVFTFVMNMFIFVQ